MSTRGVEGNWLGVSGDWGLSKAKHSELCDELSDHVSELERREGRNAAEEAKLSIAEPATRRRLAGAYIVDQVCATLNRLPDRKEWLELMWLGIWYLLIIGADSLAIYAQFQSNVVPWSYSKEPASNTTLFLVTAAWLSQAIARTGFFFSFAICLVNAGRIGWGVLIARILQLKLIHTLLVVAAHLLLGGYLWEMFPEYYGFMTNWPPWLTAPVTSGTVCLIAVLVFLTSKGHRWLLGSAILVVAILLYVGGPTTRVSLLVTRPYYSEIDKQTDGTYVRRAVNDPEAIAAKAAEYRARTSSFNFYSLIDEENNLAQFKTCDTMYLPGHFSASQNNGWGFPDYEQTRWNESEHYQVTVEPQSFNVISPVAVAGAGLGWLAVPIPFLGIIGLVSMVFLMGRRGVLEFIGYGTICGLGILSTLMPFMVRDYNESILLNARGLVYTPFPGFEALMSNPNFNDYLWLTLVGCLILSAGVPWLLTAMFLKPQQPAPREDGGALAE